MRDDNKPVVTHTYHYSGLIGAIWLYEDGCPCQCATLLIGTPDGKGGKIINEEFPLTLADRKALAEALYPPE